MITYDRLLTKRSLLTALGHLAGTRATGGVIATATGADVELPPFTYGIPIIGARAVASRMFRTLSSAPAPQAPAGTTVTSAGTAVPVRAVCGGESGILEPGTKVLWQPLPNGIEPIGEVGPGGLTGGVSTPGPGRCARVVALDMLAKEDAVTRIWQAQGSGFPAIVIARIGSTAEAFRSVASKQRAHTFRIFVVSTNYESVDERQGEGELLLDAIEERLQGLADVDGEIFSDPPCELGAEQWMNFSASSHVVAIDAICHYSLKRQDPRVTDGVSWQPWETTRIEVAEPATDELEARTVVDVTAEHEQ